MSKEIHHPLSESKEIKGRDRLQIKKVNCKCEEYVNVQVFYSVDIKD